MKHSYLAAGALVAVLAIWMASGMLGGDESPEDADAAGSAGAADEPRNRVAGPTRALASS